VEVELVIQQPPPPVIVRIVEPDNDLTGLSDVLIGSLGLTGVLILVAVVLAAIFAGLLYLWRSRRGGQDLPPSNDLRLS
jgi:hypothetical protein